MPNMLVQFVQLQVSCFSTKQCLLRQTKDRTNKGLLVLNILIGHNVLGNTVKVLSEKGGLAEHFTNHSLQANSTTRLFEAGVDE